MIDFDFSKHCTGCSVCADVCPLKCITIGTDAYDFVIPKVDVTKCVNCGLCNKVCPYLSPSFSDNLDQHVYSAYNKNEVERDIGSSGSIMIIIAKYVLNKGGVVYGAEFIDHLKLYHTRATSLSQVLRQSKSKYLQSNTEGVYLKVKNDLKNGLIVLFVGTPCQTQALNNFLGKDRSDNLILVDFICHGVPSQVLFDKSISKYEKQNECEVINFSFREKSPDRLRSYKIEYKKDFMIKTEMGIEDEFPFYYGYLKYNIFRESCYECKFANPNRISDFTLGDMWGLEFSPEIVDFKKGYSLLYVNTEKGKSLFDKLSVDIHFREYPLQAPETKNYAFRRPTKRTFTHQVFRWVYNRVSYDVIEQWFFANLKRANLIQRFFIRVASIKSIPMMIERYGVRKTAKRIIEKIV